MLKRQLDTSSAAGELIFHVFGAIAHFERRLIAERTKDGIAAARAKGKRPRSTLSSVPEPFILSVVCMTTDALPSYRVASEPGERGDRMPRPSHSHPTISEMFAESSPLALFI